MSTVSSATIEASPVQTIKRAWHDWEGVELTPEYLEHQAHMKDSLFALLSPLNITLLLLALTVIYIRSRSTPTPQIDPTRPITFRTFTPRILLRFNGTPSDLNKDSKVYLAVRGKVYDVTAGKNFYGPGGPYENFAGRDATRGLACQSFDTEMLTEDLDGPLDPCGDLDEGQEENLRGWIERFDEKYLIVGKLVPFAKTDLH